MNCIPYYTSCCLLKEKLSGLYSKLQAMQCNMPFAFQQGQLALSLSLTLIPGGINPRASPDQCDHRSIPISILSILFWYVLIQCVCGYMYSTGVYIVAGRPSSRLFFLYNNVSFFCCQCYERVYKSDWLWKMTGENWLGSLLVRSFFI